MDPARAAIAAHSSRIAATGAAHFEETDNSTPSSRSQGNPRVPLSAGVLTQPGSTVGTSSATQPSIAPGIAESPYQPAAQQVSADAGVATGHHTSVAGLVAPPEVTQ